MKKVLKIDSQEGVSIVEIMIAIMILSVGFLAIAKLQSKALRDVHWAQKRVTAIFLAQSYMESIPFDDLDSYHGNKKKVSMDNNDYFITTTVSPLGSATQKSIEINVLWENKSIVLETVRFQ
ncbi:type IV pilus modification protein PilV [Candidatus Magnetomorum sp. HK-1]|nr:type IV pilus modification protein PilV [Candidatus Magnetomorum sp. HK-1]